MFPSFLFTSYKQYKADSDAVANWLAQTAEKCGYSKRLLGIEGPKPTRLKGRARKRARGGAQKNSSDRQSEDAGSSDTSGDPKYLIAADRFISLAECIFASTKVHVEVPASFVSVLNRAITVRKRHYLYWYCGSKMKEGGSSEEKQAFQSPGFIGILENVREILLPRMHTELPKYSRTPPVEEASASKGSGRGSLVDLFANLDLEERSGISVNSVSSSSGQEPISTPQAQYGINRVLDGSEVHFAVHCFFNDLDKIRQYLQRVWDGYKQGAIDLVAASITTNTAIEFARLLQDDMDETFPTQTHWQNHVIYLYISTCVANGQDPEFREQPGDAMNFAVYEETEATFYTAHTVLASFGEILKPGVLSVIKSSPYGQYDVLSDRASKSSRDKYREDKALLLEVLPDLCVFALLPGSIPGKDELTRGIAQMSQQHCVPMWVVFAAQIFLDIHHTLRVQVSRGFADLVQSANYVQKSVQEIQEFHTNLRHTNWPRSNDQGLSRILLQVKNWVHTDVVEEFRTMVTKDSGFQPPPVPPFLLYKSHPLYCGLLSYNLKAMAQEASILFVNAWGAVLLGAHLYNALRQEKLISNEWPDMNLVLLLHHAADIFVGDFPKTVQDYFERYSLAMGCAVTVRATKKTPEVAASKTGARRLNDLSPVCRMFKARYCGSAPSTNLSPDDVDTILEKYNADDDDATHHFIHITGGWTNPKIRTDPPPAPHDGTPPSPSPDRARKSSGSAASGFQPTDLLDALLESLQAEMLELTFNHFRLHIFSWRLFRRLKEAVDYDLCDAYGPGYLIKESELPWIVGHILLAVARTQREANMMPPLPPPPPEPTEQTNSGLLAKAAGVMRAMLEEEAEAGGGGIEIMMLKKEFGMKVEAPDLLLGG